VNAGTPSLLRIFAIILFVGIVYPCRFEAIWSRVDAPQVYLETPYTVGSHNCNVGDINGDSNCDFLVKGCVKGLWGGIDTNAVNRVLLFLPRLVVLR
jgi:hypothetical protein